MNQIATSQIYKLDSESDLTSMLSDIRAIAKDNLYDNIDTEEFVLACSEIGRNAIRHAGGGECSLEIKKGGRILAITISDNGRGIKNLDQAMREGFSTIKTSLGLGLEVAERNVDHFHITSDPSDGTSVYMEKYRPISQDTVDYGLVSIADANYNFNGDQYVLKEYDGDTVLIGLIDGPGQGYDAYALAISCKTFIEKNYRLSLDKLMGSLHSLMDESNDEVGITASLCRISPNKIQYKGVGDTHAYILRRDEFTSLPNQGGRLGQLHKFRNGVSEYSFDHQVNIILCTDGLSVISPFDKIHGSAQQMANKLFDANHRPHGDASVLTLKYNC